MERQPWIPRDVVTAAKQMDLLTYLQRYDPGELVRLSPGVFSTCSHDSLKISHGKWCWWSRGIGGRSALDYLIKVRGMEFQAAVLHICECMGKSPELPQYKPYRDILPRGAPVFKLPSPYRNNDRVLSYLTGRGISLPLLLSCIRAGMLYEDTRHNCVFVGFDLAAGRARYGFVRSSSPVSTFLRDVYGSDKRYSFHIGARDTADTVCLFESAIDLLSYITMEMEAGRDWRGADYLSLSGIYAPQRDNRDLPLALAEYLRTHPTAKNIVLCLDNDHGGRTAAEAIRERLPSEYAAHDRFPAGKDYNAQLMAQMGISSIQTRASSTQQIKQEDFSR